MGSLNDDGQLLLTSSFDQTCRVWDVEKGACLAQLQHSAQLKQGIITPDGTRALTITGDNVAHLWDLSTGTEAHQLQVRAGLIYVFPVQSVSRPGAAAVRVTCCYILVSVCLQCSACSGASCFPMQADAGNTCSRELRCNVWACHCSETVAYGVIVHLLEAPVSPCSTTDPAAICETPARFLRRLCPCQFPVCTACLRSDPVPCTPPLQGHKDEIAHAAFSHDSDQVATCSSDCTLRVWSSETGQLEAFFNADCALSFCKFAPLEGKPDTVLTSGLNGVVHFLQLRDRS